jgi:glycosyltransferase involved in cell wall biosynthesis
VFAGRNPLPEVNALSEVAGVGVTGAVPALSDVIAKADLYVLPMRLGSGFRSKLCEVFPLEVPIVTTSVGAEGLALVHNENCLIADSAVEFARACIRLLGSHEEREQLGRNAGRLAAETYSQDTVRRQVRGLLRGLVHGQGPGAPVAESAPHSLPAVRHAHPSHQQRA